MRQHYEASYMPHGKIAKLSGCCHAAATRGSQFEHDPHELYHTDTAKPEIARAVRREREMVGLPPR